jgi:type II secretory pathway component GspD/PulD (secretin)
VLIGGDPAKLDYAELLSVLQVHGFVMVAHGDVVRVMFTVKNVPAAQLVPILRPLLPQMGHLVALPCTNMLMIVDTLGNVQRIEKLVQSLDVGGPYTPQKCEGEKPSG